jgi:hypothetical protein
MTMLRIAVAALAASGLAQAAGLKDGADCGGFTAADGAAWLKVPAAQVSRHVQKSGKSLWICSFAAGRAPPGISFSLDIAADAKKAEAEMERYRDNLAITGGTAPFKDRLPKGAYSDIMGLGDEGVWTDVNGTLTVRKGNVTLQVQMPKEKLEQVRLAKEVIAKIPGR